MNKSESKYFNTAEKMDKAFLELLQRKDFSFMKKVVILGGGPAGLTAAYELLKDTKDEYEVTILEESGVLGGISQTVRYHVSLIHI